MKNNMLTKALNQEPVKIKKQKPVFTKSEIEYILFVLKLVNPGCMAKEHKGSVKKLNNQLKKLYENI